MVGPALPGPAQHAARRRRTRRWPKSSRSAPTWLRSTTTRSSDPARPPDRRGRPLPRYRRRATSTSTRPSPGATGSSSATPARFGAGPAPRRPVRIGTRAVARGDPRRWLLPRRLLPHQHRSVGCSGVHAAYTVALTHRWTAGRRHRGDSPGRSPPKPSSSPGSDSLTTTSEGDFRTWSNTTAFPLLPDAQSGEILLQMREHPRFDATDGFEFRPVAELHATGDKAWFDFDLEHPKGDLPVLAGASFNLWDPDHGDPYAYAQFGS